MFHPISPGKLVACLACVVSLGIAGQTFAQEAAAPLAIENDSLRVSVDSSGQFSIQSLPGGKTAAAVGKFVGASGQPKKASVNDKTFGDGQAIDVGNSSQVMVFPHVPFALLRGKIASPQGGGDIVNRAPIATFAVDLGKPTSDLKTLGTGGLMEPGKDPGSYTWFVVADPQTRNGVVAAWVTQDRGSGVFFPKLDGDKITIEARNDFGRLRVPQGQSADSELLAIGYFDDARLGLEQWADTVAKVYNIHLPPQPVGYCTWYAEKNGHAGDQRTLGELADFAAQNLKPYGFNFIQIDDGWQLGEKKNGPKKNFTDFNPQGPYPDGMKAMADKIKSDGFMPGLWFMPFAGTFNDPWFAQHQDWFVKDKEGKPYDVKWGGTCLDMTNPQVQDYLRGIVHHIAKDWGYTYFKMDGLWTGMAAKLVYVNSGYKEDNLGDATFSNPDKTNIEAYRDGLKIVREAAGPDVFFLGCNVAQDMRVYGASFGLVDAMRIGPDNGGTWERWSTRSPVLGGRNYFLNGRIWYNDPDPEYLRASIPDVEARTIASWTAISGQLNTDSDWLPDLPPERLNLLRRTMPSHGKTARPVDLFENDPPRMWVVTDEKSEPRRDVIALFNWTDEQQTFDVPLSRFGLPEAKEYAAFDFWADKYLLHLSGNLKTTLPPHACQVLAIRPLQDHPFLLSTSRHITQGMVDVTEERWDSGAKALSGKSEVVGNDPYELRILVPSVQGVKNGTLQISPDDSAAGVQVQKMNFNGVGEFRATIVSSTSRSVTWKAVFTANGQK